MDINAYVKSPSNNALQPPRNRCAVPGRLSFTVSSCNKEVA